jgi:hypothetical protein
MTRILSFTFLTFVAGCAYPNQFRNVRTDSPHAVLVGDGVTLMHIKDQPTSFWRTRERFRVSPGSTTVHVISGYRGDVHYPLIRFTAEADHSYSVQRQRADDSDRVIVREAGERIVAQAKRESTPRQRDL